MFVVLFVHPLVDVLWVGIEEAASERGVQCVWRWAWICFWGIGITDMIVLMNSVVERLNVDFNPVISAQGEVSLIHFNLWQYCWLRDMSLPQHRINWSRECSQEELAS